MAYGDAGKWGPEGILTKSGASLLALPSLPVTVYLTGTTTLATLYTDRTKATTAANPATTDSVGNLAFYADPGLYDLSFSVPGATTSTKVTVEVNLDYADPTPGTFDSTFQTERGYIESTTNATTTNTAYGSATSNKIPGLSVTVVGEGLPVGVEFFCNSAYHSVAGTIVTAVLIINGSVSTGQLASTKDGMSLTMLRRKVLTSGVSYTFEIGMYGGAAGTTTFSAFSDGPMHLAVRR